jgi:hypothetical protein
MVDLDLVNGDGLPVRLPSSAEYKVLTQAEVNYVKKRVKDYTAAFKWDNTSDLQDVDRMIMFELLVYRYGIWVSRRLDYFDDPVDENQLRKSMNELSAELRQLKKSLGIDRISRDKERGEDSVPAYLENLRQRAKEFGINRNNMMDKGIVLSQQLIALHQLHRNCDALERVEQRCRAEDVMDWIATVYVPQFQAVDKKFRDGQQRYWIQDL